MLRLITAPAARPVTLAEAKEWCRVDSDDTSQDTVLDILIRAATATAEHLTGRAFVERTYELDLDGFEHTIELPMAPLIGIDWVKYLASSDNTLTTFDSASYEVDTASLPGRVRPVATSAWPSIGTGFNPVRIQYRAGVAYPGSPTDLTDNSYLPAELRQWLAARIATAFENREALAVDRGNLLALPRDYCDALLDPLVIGTRMF